MAVYEYRHVEKACDIGEIFEVEHPISEPALQVCPQCGGAVQRLISRTFISTPRSDTDLKQMGFTKLVKRDQGVYENVTATGKESRYMRADKPETLPDLKRKIRD